MKRWWSRDSGWRVGPVPHGAIALVFGLGCTALGWWLLHDREMLIAELRAAEDHGLPSTGLVPSTAVAVLGVILSLALSALVFGMVVARHRAQRLVARMTESIAARNAEISRLAQVAERTDNIVTITNLAGEIEWVNPAFTRVTGYTLAEARGKRPGQLLHGEQTDLATVETMRQALERGERFTCEVINYTKSRRPYWTQVEVQPLRDSAGDVSGWMAVNRDITVMREHEATLQRERSLMHSLVDSITDLICWKDGDGRILGCNAAYARLLGQHKFALVGRYETDLLDEDEAMLSRRLDRQVMDSTEPYKLEQWVTYPDGQQVVLDTCKAPYIGPGGALVGVLEISRDDTRRKHAEQLLRTNEARFRGALEAGLDAFLLMTAERGREGQITDFVVSDCNDRAAMLLGRGREAIVGAQMSALVECPSDLGLLDEFIRVVETGRPFVRDTHVRSEGVQADWLHQQAVRADDGVAVTLRDITDAKRLEGQLRRDATTDKLTGLANRAAIMTLVEDALAMRQRDASLSYAVLFLDFDRFKLINDSLGHDAGDELLVSISKRLQEGITRQYGEVALTSGRVTAARLGGDEFLVLVADPQAADSAEAFAEELCHVLADPYIIAGNEVHSTASIGITTSQFDYHGADDVIRDADTAMYEAKRRGKAQYVVFTQSMHHQVMGRLQLESDLAKAFENGDLKLRYQPIVNLENAQLEAFEVLLRWEHPERGVLSPDVFLPVAEEAGLMVKLGGWVYREAASELSRWQRLMPGTHLPSLNLNISARELVHRSFVSSLEQVFREAGVAPSMFRLEVTEAAIMHAPDTAAAILRELKMLGCGISMDAFGTGSSSLSCLHRFPIDQLKVDRSFITNMRDRLDLAAVVHSIVTLAHNLDMTVTAEGVREMEQVAQLQALGCDFAQGYLFAPPLPADQALSFIGKDLRPSLAG